MAAIQEADEAELAARGAGAGLSGRLRVSAATTFARLDIIPLLPRFLERHPELEVDVTLDDRTIDLVAEGVDVSIRIGALPDSSALARKLADGLAALAPLTGRYKRMAVTQRLRRLLEEGVGYGLALEGISAADVARGMASAS